MELKVYCDDFKYYYYDEFKLFLYKNKHRLLLNKYPGDIGVKKETPAKERDDIKQKFKDNNLTEVTEYNGENYCVEGVIYYNDRFYIMDGSFQYSEYSGKKYRTFRVTD